MSARFMTVAAAIALAGGSPAIAADQLRPDNIQQASQPKPDRNATVLASADAVRVPDPLKPEQSAVTAKRPRAARVTSCRCGEPTAN